MISRRHLVLAAICSTSMAQQPATPAPKKDPFANFSSALDKRPGGTPSAPASAPAVATAGSGAGISLAPHWDALTAQSRGGQSGKIDDLVFLLSAYGTPGADTAAHPEATVYEGPQMDGTGTCKIAYLTPLEEAKKALFNRAPGPVSGSKAVAPGFPDGLFLYQFDIKCGVYNRLTIVTDSAKPQPQVVSLQFKNERQSWHPTHFKEVARDWHTYDYVNARNRGQPGIVIHTRVNDLRKPSHYIVANMAFGIPPQTGGWVQVNSRPNETSTWFLPEPLIGLILFSATNQQAK